MKFFLNQDGKVRSYKFADVAIILPQIVRQLAAS
jgi:hypothetical protein